MKRLLCLLLALIFVFALFSCADDKYPPVESTDEEKTVLMTMTVGKDTYEVRYELYRALFLNLSEEFDGGDKSFWTKPEADAAREELDAMILEYIKDIFATISLAKSIGFDAYSNEADKIVNDYIAMSVEGSGANLGYEGDYNAYLAAIKEMNLNYSVQTLMYRYSIAYEKLVTYYAGNIDPDSPMPDATEGKLEYTAEDVEAFYYGDDSVRTSVIEINAQYISYERTKEIRDEIASHATATHALNYAISHTAGDPDDILKGVMIGTNSLDAAFYSDVTKEAFSLEVNETSDIITITTENETKYWILYRLDKDEAYFEENYDSIVSVYKSQKIGEMLSDLKNSIENIEYTDEYRELDISEIKMK